MGIEDGMRVDFYDDDNGNKLDFLELPSIIVNLGCDIDLVFMIVFDGFISVRSVWTAFLIEEF